MSALTPIDQVIRQLCFETGEPDAKNYDLILSHVRGAIIDLKLYVIPSVKTVVCKVNGLSNIDWPKDCVKPVVVGLSRGSKICNISIDSGIAPASNCGCSSMTEVEQNINETLQNSDVDPYLYNGIEGYGQGYDSIRACTHDKENRITNVKFKLLPGDKIQFTYISDGIGTGVTHVPAEAETAIGEWVFWKYYRRTYPSLSDRGRQNYKEEFTRLRKFYNDVTIDQWIKAIVKR